ncbi:hypothetical protein MIMGU_mgv1a019372mg, partial [Erythranthe guttata]
MTDPNPLLSHTESAAAAASPSPPQRRSLDETIEHCIGNFGLTQFLQSTIASFAWFFDAQQTFIAVFTDAEPKWSCNMNSSTCTTAAADMCRLPKGSWSWDSPAQTSIISEWSLECAGSITTGLGASSFFLGCLAGGFLLSTLADSSLGRKNLLVLSCLLMSLTGLLTAVSTNIWMYAGFRFLSGFARAPIGTCALVLGTELVGKKWRGNVGIIGFIWFTFGFLSLSIIAFFVQNSSWRLIYLWTCVPCVLYSLLVYFAVEESPRWLFFKGRRQEFEKSLKTLASPENQSSLTESFFCNSVDWGVEEKPREYNLFSALGILLKRPWAFRRLILTAAVAFGLGLMYTGMPLSLGNLSVNLHLSVAVNALSELPASVAAILLVGKLNRRGSILGLAVLSGVCSAACAAAVTWKGLQVSLELVSFFCTCAAFDVFMIYALELFPTCVRNSAVAMVRQAVAVGGVVSPVLVAAGRKNGWVFYGVCGGIVCVSGLFVVWLPETRGRTPCDTMEEEELKF